MIEKWQPPSPTACKLKWAWSTVFLNSGTTKSCFHNPVQKFNTETFDFHNIPIKIADRKQMLAGEWPAGCAYCSQTESVGGKSDRESHNDILDIIPDTLELETTPKLVEIFFNNTCNMSCLYCGPKLSSTWAQEVDKFGPSKINHKISPLVDYNRQEYVETLDNFFNWWDGNKTKIERLNILGGEPFLLKETDRLLNVLEQDQLNLELNLVSNLMISPKIFDMYLERLVKLINNRCVTSVVIMASLDGWGPEIDFQRWGLDRELWLRNFNRLLETTEIKIDINLAITCLGIPAMPALIKMWNSWNKIRPVGLQGTRVFDPSFLAPEVLPEYLNRQYFEEALDLIPIDTWYKKWSKEKFSNLLPVFDKYPDGNIIEMKKLKTYLDEISSRRLLDWTKIFPQINKEFLKL